MNRTKALALAAGTLLLLGTLYFSPLRFLDNLFYDLNFAFAPAPAADSVVVVGIDVKSIGAVGTWPWPRAQTARLIRRINACRPRAVALDMLFPRSDDAAGSESLAVAFAAVERLVLPFRAGTVSADPQPGEAAVPGDVFTKRFMMLREERRLAGVRFFHVKQFATLDSMFSRHADYGGFVNVSTSNTSQKLREAVHVMQAGGEYYPSFGLAAVAAYYGLTPERFVLSGEGPSVILGERRVPLSSYAASALVNFRSDKAPVRVVSASDVLAGAIDPRVLAGRLVFVGITDAAAGADFFTTPVRSQFPGVEMWATAALDILQGAWVRFGGGPLAIANWALALLLFPGLALVVPATRKPVAVAMGLVFLAGGVAASVVLFGRLSYFWSPASQLYGWVFSLLWLAAQKASPVLAEGGSIPMEPATEDERDIRPPATPDDYIKAVPRTDTALAVVRRLAPQALQAGSGGVPKAVFEQIRSLAGGQIVGTLGSGGMADVYLVWNPRLEVYRAVKVIKAGQNAQMLERFETEIRIFAKLSHPNIVVCYGVGEWNKLPAVEMEYVHGTALESILRKRGTLTTPQALVVGILTCRALHYAHNQVITLYGKTYRGVVHRDIKPANILISRGGRVKLTDFGIARPGEVSLHTMDAGQVVGTLPYLAPEQLSENAELTARTDIYALGATLYEFIAGARAFPQRELTTLVRAKTFGTVETLKRSEQVPQLLVDTIAKAMAIEPGKRHASAAELGRDLERCLRELKVSDGYAHLREMVDSYWAAKAG